jgi:uncharacterized membrane protein
MNSELLPADQNHYISDATALDSYRVGWKLLRAHFWLLIGATFIYILLDIPAEIIEGKDNDILSTLSAIFISGPICMSLEWLFLRAARRETVKLSNMFSVFKRNYWCAVGGFVLKTLLIILGLILFILPGILVALRLSFVELLIIDQKMGPLEAIKESWRMTRGHEKALFIMLLLAIPIFLLGLLGLVVGAIVSTVWIYAASTALYLAIVRIPNTEEPTA